MTRNLIGLILLQLLLGAVLSAQSRPAREHRWGIGITIGTSTFNGAARGTGETGEKLVFVPYRPTNLGVQVSRGRDLHAALSFRYGEPGIGFRGTPNDGSGQPTQGVLIVIEHAYREYSAGGSLSKRLFRLRGGPSLRGSAGATVERWSAPGTPERWIAGPFAGLSMETELSGRFSASIDGELGYTSGSPFQAGDLPEGFELRSTWRRTLGVTLWLRL